MNPPDGPLGASDRHEEGRLERLPFLVFFLRTEVKEMFLFSMDGFMF